MKQTSNPDTAHTPGPWKIEAEVNRDGSCLLIADSEGAIVIADCRHDMGVDSCAEAEANARLIAAAPTLLAEAVELLRNATFADGLGTIRTQDAEALEAAIASVTRNP